MDKDITDSVERISEYNVTRNDRNREGGGVAIYYRNCLNVKSIDDLIPKGLEAVNIEVLEAKCS